MSRQPSHYICSVFSQLYSFISCQASEAFSSFIHSFIYFFISHTLTLCVQPFSPPPPCSVCADHNLSPTYHTYAPPSCLIIRTLLCERSHGDYLSSALVSNLPTPLFFLLFPPVCRASRSCCAAHWTAVTATAWHQLLNRLDPERQQQFFLCDGDS